MRCAPAARGHKDLPIGAVSQLENQCRSTMSTGDVKHPDDRSRCIVLDSSLTICAVAMTSTAAR